MEAKECLTKTATIRRRKLEDVHKVLVRWKEERNHALTILEEKMVKSQSADYLGEMKDDYICTITFNIKPREEKK